jgi:DNA-binding FadR family transcriptional regulator
MTAVSRRTLVERVGDEILDLIAEQGYELGSSLPSTSQLAARFEVSAVVVREAMATLAGRGIVRRVQGREPTIGRPGSEVLETVLRVRTHQDELTLEEFLQCRAPLELQSAALAAASPDAEVRAAVLEPIMTRLRNWSDETDPAEADHAFHLALADLSGNRLIQLLLASLNSVMHEALTTIFRELLERYDEQGPEVRLRTHERIADAVIAGDPVEATLAMADHFLFWEELELGMVGLTGREVASGSAG